MQVNDYLSRIAEILAMHQVIPSASNLPETELDEFLDFHAELTREMYEHIIHWVTLLLNGSTCARTTVLVEHRQVEGGQISTVPVAEMTRSTTHGAHN